MSREIRIARLRAGEEVQYRESGNSMRGIIGHRQLITCSPISEYSTLATGDAVFCKVHGNHYTHLIKGVRSHTKDDGSVTFDFLIGNNRGGTNGWTPQHNVFGKVIRVAP